MSLRVWYALMIVVLLFSTVGFAEILPWGDGSTSGGAFAAASHGDEFDSDSDSGGNGYYTTVAGFFDYNYDGFADIECYVDAYDGWGCSAAIAQANAGPSSAYIEYNTHATTEDETYDPLADDPDEYNDSMYFDAYTGVYASWVVIAVCQIEEGTYSNTYAWAYAYASANMQ